MLRILFAVLCMWYARCFLLLLCCMFYVHTFDTLPIWAHTIRAYNIFTLLRRIVMIFGFVGCSWFSFVFLLFSLLFSRSSQREYVLSPLRLLLWDANSSFEQRNVLYFCVCFLCLDNFLFLFALFDRSMSKQRKHPPNVFIFIIHSTVFISVPTLIPPQPKKKKHPPDQFVANLFPLCLFWRTLYVYSTFQTSKESSRKSWIKISFCELKNPLSWIRNSWIEKFCEPFSMIKI